MDAKTQRIGYVRVSTADQNPERQLVALGDLDKTFTEFISGKDRDRPELQAMLNSSAKATKWYATHWTASHETSQICGTSLTR